VQAVLPKGRHPLLNRHLLQRPGRHLLQNRIPHDLLHHQHLAQRTPPSKTSPQTLLTALPLAKHRLLLLRRRHQLQHHRVRLIRRTAPRAVASNQPQAPAPRHARCQQERLDVHVDQPRKHTRRAPRVNRADHQMPRQPRLHRNRRRLRIPDLPHHDHLRILSHQRPQRPRVSEFLQRVDLRLAHQRQVVLHRILDRADADRRTRPLHQMRQRRVNRRRLARPRRPRQQHHPARTVQQPHHGLLRRVLKPKIPNSKLRFRGSNNRTTIFSPRTVGNTEIRNSTWFSSGPVDACPSCGMSVW
jgi:hypothetical protein